MGRGGVVSAEELPVPGTLGVDVQTLCGFVLQGTRGSSWFTDTKTEAWGLSTSFPFLGSSLRAGPQSCL